MCTNIVQIDLGILATWIDVWKICNKYLQYHILYGNSKQQGLSFKDTLKTLDSVLIKKNEENRNEGHGVKGKKISQDNPRHLAQMDNSVPWIQEYN